MCLPNPRPPGAEVHPEATCCGAPKLEMLGSRILRGRRAQRDAADAFSGDGAEAAASGVLMWPRSVAWRVNAWRASGADCHIDRGADAATARYQIANSRSHVSLRVFLRLTAMDVCCGPPSGFFALLVA